MPTESALPAWQRAVIALAATSIGVVVIGVLYWAQAVFIPVVLAVFFTFLLNSLVRAVERRGLGRLPAVVLVVVLSTVVLSGLVWLVADQVTRLVGDLPAHTENIKGRVKYLRDMGKGALAERLDQMIREVTGEWEAAGEGVMDGAGEPTKVVVQPESPPWLARLPVVLSPVLELLTTLTLAAVLAVFMLLKREDLRNRFIRLVGVGRITGTTKAVDDACERVSRYLLMQLVINGTYGFAWGLGLWLIGLQYAVLWGFLAVVLRYVPYIGAPIAALLPIALSLAQFPGWWEPLAVLGLLLALELLSNNIMEPWLYGMSMGVSEVAGLVAAAFWGFLWGPIGLVLSSPLTVVLVVLGKYVPQLEFFDVLLGDQPVLKPEVAYYQRLVAHDQDEAFDMVTAQLKRTSPESIYDELLIPPLSFVKRDRMRDELTEADEDFICQATREMLEDLGSQQVTRAVDAGKAAVAAAESGGADAEHAGEAAIAEPSTSGKTSALPRVRVLGVPAQDEPDLLALEMFKQLLDPGHWDLEITALELLTAELVERIAEEQVAAVCIASIPPGGLAHSRYLCKRLRARFPELKILVGRWNLTGGSEANREQLLDAGGDVMCTSLLEARDQLNAWRPVLAYEEERIAG